MTIDEQISYFEKAYKEAKTKDLALVAFGIYVGLKRAKEALACA